MFKSAFSICVLLTTSVFSYSQETPALMLEGQKLEQQFKAPEALAKYQQVLSKQPSNIKAAVKCAELCCAIGSRENTKEGKTKWFNDAKGYAATAVLYSPSDVEANYIMAVTFGKLTETETSNNKLVEDVKATKTYADKALAIDAKYGKAWYVIGKWHYEVMNLNVVKRAAVKVIYGGLAATDIDTCIAAFVKCKTLEPYFCPNYMALAKAYRYNKQFEKALATLQQCIKCPSRQQDDPAIKEEAKKLLVEWQ